MDRTAELMCMVRLFFASLAIVAFFGIISGLGIAKENINIVPQIFTTSFSPIDAIFSPGDDNLLMVLNREGRIDLLDISEPNSPIKVKEIWAGATAATMTPGAGQRHDMKVIAGRSDGTLWLWKLDGNSPLGPFEGHGGSTVTYIVASSDGSRIASGDVKGTVRVWAVEADGLQLIGPPLQVGWDSPVKLINFSPNGRRLLAANETSLTIWTQHNDASFQRNPWWRSHMFLPDGRRFVGVEGEENSTWEDDADQYMREKRNRSGPFIVRAKYSSKYLQVLFVDEDAIVTNFSRLSVFSKENLKDTNAIIMIPEKKETDPWSGNLIIEEDDAEITAMSASIGGSYVLVGTDRGSLQLFDREANFITPLWHAHDREEAYGRIPQVIVRVSFSSKYNKFLSIGKEGIVKVWKLENNLLEKGDEVSNNPSVKYVRDRNKYTISAVSPDGKLFAIAGWESGHLAYSASSEGGASEPILMEKGEGVSSIAFSPDGKLLTLGRKDGGVSFLISGTSAKVADFNFNSDWVNKITFSADGKWMLTGHRNGEIRLWSLENDISPVGFVKTDASILNVKLSTNGETILSSDGSGTVLLWRREDFISGSMPMPRVVARHESAVWAIAISPDEQKIVSGDSDGIVRLSILKKGEDDYWEWRGEREVIDELVFSEDGARVAFVKGLISLSIWNYKEKVTENFQCDWCLVANIEFKNGHLTYYSHPIRHDNGLKKYSIGYKSHELSSYKSKITKLNQFETISDSGDKFVSLDCENNAVELLKFRKKEKLDIFKYNEKTPEDCSVTLDGRMLFSTYRDGGIYRMSLYEGGKIEKISIAPEVDSIVDFRSITGIVTSQDGAFLALTFMGGRIIILESVDGEFYRIYDDLEGRIAYSLGGIRFIGREKIIINLFEGSYAEYNIREKNVDIHDYPHIWRSDSRYIYGPIDGVSIYSDKGGFYAVQESGNNTKNYDRLYLPSEFHKIKRLSAKKIAIICNDRIVIIDRSLTIHAQLFYSPDGINLLLALGEGHHKASEKFPSTVAFIGNNLNVDYTPDLVSSLSERQVRQILFDDWTFSDRIAHQFFRFYWQSIHFAEGLGWKIVPFIALMAWFFYGAILAAVWLLRPAALAHKAMQSDDQSNDKPPIVWYVQAIFLISLLGASRRPLTAWLRHNRASLVKKTFLDCPPVQDRQKYCHAIHETDLERAFKAFVPQRSRKRSWLGWRSAPRHSSGEPEVWWIQGKGGSGKSSFAFAIGRKIAASKTSPLPILIAQDWDNGILNRLSRNLCVKGKRPTEQMVSRLWAWGELCVIFDSLSERSCEHPESDIAALYRSGTRQKILITSRNPPPPQGHEWNKKTEVKITAVKEEHLNNFVEAYVGEKHAPIILERLQNYTHQHTEFSPLLLRLLIDEANRSESISSTIRGIISKYIVGLAESQTQLWKEDFVYASRFAAYTCTCKELRSQQIKHESMQQAIENHHNERKIPFRKKNGEDEATSNIVLECLIKSGLLIHNSDNGLGSLQFSHDPVAEILTIIHAVDNKNDNLLKKIRKSKGEMSRFLAEMEKELQPNKCS